MPMTMTQKILADHAGLDSVAPGDLIEAKLDYVLGNDVTTPPAIKVFEKLGVKDVFDNMNSDQRAYTTIKTVMDRLVGKEMLIRKKIGKKFCYKATESRSKMADTAINKLLKQYFNNDASLLLKTIEKQCIK